MKQAAATSRKKPRKLHLRVTHLEMRETFRKSFPLPTRPSTALMRAENIPGSFYAYLYQMVGKNHHWELRRNLEEAELYALINEANCEIQVLYVDGCPAGFFELDLSNLPQKVEILYLGIGPDHQGLGLGKWFIAAAIDAAWSHGPEKVVLTTNTLDHPAALPLYQRLGFSPVAVSEETVTAWDDDD